MSRDKLCVGDRWFSRLPEHESNILVVAWIEDTFLGTERFNPFSNTKKHPETWEISYFIPRMTRIPELTGLWMHRHLCAYADHIIQDRYNLVEYTRYENEKISYNFEYIDSYMVNHQKLRLPNPRETWETSHTRYCVIRDTGSDVLTVETIEGFEQIELPTFLQKYRFFREAVSEDMLETFFRMFRFRGAKTVWDLLDHA